MFKIYSNKNEFVDNIFTDVINQYNKYDRYNYLIKFYDDNKSFYILSINGKIYIDNYNYSNYDYIVNTLLDYNFDLSNLEETNLLNIYNKRIDKNTKRAIFAGGCFWCSAKAYYNTGGIKKVLSGYCGGDEVCPKYEDVKAQKTHHQESILIEYDETKVSYKKLVDIFFNTIDPFDSEGQFIDRGHSYTTAIFTDDLEERKIIEDKIKEIENETKMKVYMPIKDSSVFYMAEEYHQDFHIKHPDLMEKELIESGRKK